ncbi:aspartic peptidase domain-containing protein [Podospora fimiseda]|uniref:Aspartic peptidase domain-containing protein n=1 Tax=Podospora fimiseda TaxID=252190 RepID=A0AAN7BD87_9PEZI|nr:aspartic peptidase domain-containing protein [Podospora fimiseda]
MWSIRKFWAIAHFFAICLAQNSSPKPLVIPPSQYWDGNDGPWSTFDLRVGKPEQFMRVAVSTASPHSIVPLSQFACEPQSFPAPPSDCAVSRGNLFDLNESSTWTGVGVYGINNNGVGLGAHLGYEQRAEWGLDELGVGLRGPKLENQSIAGIATPEPFYLGIFGLNNQPVNFSSLGNQSTPAYITTLKDQNKIPSISWSYTAGAKYRLKQVNGQLIFGGYDASRFTENSVSFTMADDVTRDLVVSLQSISYSGSMSATLLSDSIDIYIDSTDPNLWLPSKVVDEFEKAFDLTLDETSGLYLVNETHRNSLINSNAQVSFRLSDVRDGGDTVTIVLPYAAFDLTAKHPLVDNTSHYFPLKRANSLAQYTLGRTFLQEAYLSADYERKVFNVSACKWEQGAEENIITITSKDSPDSQLSPSDPDSGGLSSGAIAGIVIGSIVGAALLAALIAFIVLRKRRKWIGKGFAVAKQTKDPLAEPDESVLKGPVFNSDSFRRASSTAAGSSSAPFSAADISAARTTESGVSSADNSRSASGVSPRTGLAAAAVASQNAGKTAELDGQDTLIKPDTELDGNEIPRPLPVVSENPSGVYELPASPNAIQPGAERNRQGILGHGVQEGEHSPPSPVTSTMESSARGFGRQRQSMANSEMVSPDTPTHRHEDRPF